MHIAEKDHGRVVKGPYASQIASEPVCGRYGCGRRIPCCILLHGPRTCVTFPSSDVFVHCRNFVRGFLTEYIAGNIPTIPFVAYSAPNIVGKGPKSFRLSVYYRRLCPMDKIQTLDDNTSPFREGCSFAICGISDQ